MAGTDNKYSEFCHRLRKTTKYSNHAYYIKIISCRFTSKYAYGENVKDVAKNCGQKFYFSLHHPHNKGVSIGYTDKLNTPSIGSFIVLVIK